MGGELIPADLQQLETVALTPELLATPQFAEQYQQLVEVAKRIADIKVNVDNAIKGVVRDRFLETGAPTVLAEGYRYTYVPETTSERWDTRALKAEDPATYKKYVKVTHVNDSIRIYAPKSVGNVE